LLTIRGDNNVETTKVADKMITKLVSMWERAPAQLSEPGFGFDIWELAVLCGVIEKNSASSRRQAFLSGAMDDLPSVQQFMRDRGWVRILQLEEGDRHRPVLYPTTAGVDYVRKGRPWTTRFLRVIEESVKTIVVSVITSAITAIVIYFILNWLTQK
jgi:hypothetical protein